jgi:hypothetical protein
MTKISKLHKQWSKDPEYTAVYGSMQTEFEFTKQLINKRIKNGTSQGELAKKIVASHPQKNLRSR